MRYKQSLRRFIPLSIAVLFWVVVALFTVIDINPTTNQWEVQWMHLQLLLPFVVMYLVLEFVIYPLYCKRLRMGAVHRRLGADSAGGCAALGICGASDDNACSAQLGW